MMMSDKPVLVQFVGVSMLFQKVHLRNYVGTSMINKHERPVFLEIQEFLEFQIN